MDLASQHKACTEALDAYMVELRKSCGLLGNVERFPIGHSARDLLVQQRRTESVALSVYLTARNSLYDAASWR